eukprot:scaffold670395_cov79-Prasinocladus_malaysianus.AAC.1
MVNAASGKWLGKSTERGGIGGSTCSSRAPPEKALSIIRLSSYAPVRTPWEAAAPAEAGMIPL